MDDRLESLEREQVPSCEHRPNRAKGTARPARIGVLALQGDFAAHASILRRVGAEVSEVRTPREVQGLDGLILPGGESTTLLRLLRGDGMDQRIREFHRNGGALFGTCAGLILLATEVTGPEQESLGLLDVSVERNAYGRQVDSFVARGNLYLPRAEAAEAATGTKAPAKAPEAQIPGTDASATLEMVFIRAPRILRVGKRVEIVGRVGDEAVLVRSGKILAAAFHPEIAGDPRIHAWFCALARG